MSARVPFGGVVRENLRAFRVAILAVAWVLACGDETTARRSGVNIVGPNEASPDAIQVSGTFLDSAQSDESGTLLTIPNKGNERELGSLREGSVIVAKPTAAHPDGLFVVVVEIRKDGDNTILVVEQASLEDALAEGSQMAVDLGDGETKGTVAFDFAKVEKVSRVYERGTLSFENVQQHGLVHFRLETGVKTAGSIDYAKVTNDFAYEGSGRVALSIDATGSNTNLTQDLAVSVVGRGLANFGPISIPYHITAHSFGVCSFEGAGIDYTDTLHAFGTPQFATEWRDGNWRDISPPVGSAKGVDPSKAVIAGTGTLNAARCAVPLEFYLTFGAGRQGPTIRLAPVTQLNDGTATGAKAETSLGIAFGGSGSVIGRRLKHVPLTPSRATDTTIKKAVFDSLGTRRSTQAYSGLSDQIDFGGNAAKSLGITSTVGEDTPALPTYDWATANKLTSVKDQGACKGDWAFATTAAIESSALIKSQRPATNGSVEGLNLAEQDLIGCASASPVYPTLSECHGGGVDEAMLFAAQSGIRTEAANGYRADNPEAKDALTCGGAESDGAMVTTWGRLQEADTVLHRPSVVTIKEALLRRGPIVATISATEAFMNAESVPVADQPVGPAEGFHSVLIVGWDDKRHAWKVKNSWSSDWGIGGYGWVRWDALNVGMDATWVDASPPCEPAQAVCSQPPAGFSAGAGLAPIDRCAFQLKESAGIATPQALVTALEAITTKVTVADVMGDLDRTATANPAVPGGPPGVSVAFAWSAEDQAAEWVPQGLTGSADADATGLVGGKRIVIVSFYDHSARDNGARLAFVDITNPQAPKYRYALLVSPSGSVAAPSFAPVRTHAGGIVWFGHYLYVAQTGKGLRVFDLDHILRVAEDADVIGCSGGLCRAALDRYVVPEIGNYTSLSPCDPIFSFVALDRSATPPSLVTGEYCSSTACSSPLAGRLLHFPLNPVTGLLRAPSTYATEAFLMGQVQVQGAVSYKGTHYLSSSAPGGGGGALYRVAPNKSATSTWGDAPEDLMVDGPNNLIFSLSEFAPRVVYGASLASYPPP